MLSARETRIPFRRRRLENSTSFSSMARARSARSLSESSWRGEHPARSPGIVRCSRHDDSDSLLVQHVLVALDAGALLLGPLVLDVVLQLLLRLPDVALVLEDGGERLRDQLIVERLDVQDGERLRPVERLADARRLLQVELPDAMHHGDHVARQALRDTGDLQAHDLELLGPLGEVDEEMEAAPLERVGHLAGV